MFTKKVAHCKRVRFTRFSKNKSLLYSLELGCIHLLRLFAMIPIMSIGKQFAVLISGWHILSA